MDKYPLEVRDGFKKLLPDLPGNHLALLQRAARGHQYYIFWPTCLVLRSAIPLNLLNAAHD